jgi:hypothetical protein
MLILLLEISTARVNDEKNGREYEIFILTEVRRNQILLVINLIPTTRAIDGGVRKSTLAITLALIITIVLANLNPSSGSRAGK